MSSPIAAPLPEDPLANADRGVGGFGGMIVFGTGRGAGVNGGKGDGGAHAPGVFVLSGTQTEGEIVAAGGEVCTGGNVVTPCANTKVADKATATSPKPNEPTKRISTSRRINSGTMREALSRRNPAAGNGYFQCGSRLSINAPIPSSASASSRLRVITSAA